MSRVIKNNDGVAVVEGTPAASLIKDSGRFFNSRRPRPRMAGEDFGSRQINKRGGFGFGGGDVQLGKVSQPDGSTLITFGNQAAKSESPLPKKLLDEMQKAGVKPVGKPIVNQGGQGEVVIDDGPIKSGPAIPKKLQEEMQKSGVKQVGKTIKTGGGQVSIDDGPMLGVQKGGGGMVSIDDGPMLERGNPENQNRGDRRKMRRGERPGRRMTREERRRMTRDPRRRGIRSISRRRPEREERRDQVSIDDGRRVRGDINTRRPISKRPEAASGSDQVNINFGLEPGSKKTFTPTTGTSGSDKVDISFGLEPGSKKTFTPAVEAKETLNRFRRRSALQRERSQEEREATKGRFISTLGR